MLLIFLFGLISLFWFEKKRFFISFYIFLLWQFHSLSFFAKSVCLFFLSVWLSVSCFIYKSVRLSICLSACLSVFAFFLSVCLSISLSVCLFACMQVCLFSIILICLSFCLAECLTSFLQVCLLSVFSVCLSVSFFPSLSQLLDFKVNGYYRNLKFEKILNSLIFLIGWDDI